MLSTIQNCILNCAPHFGQHAVHSFQCISKHMRQKQWSYCITAAVLTLFIFPFLFLSVCWKFVPTNTDCLDCYRIFYCYCFLWRWRGGWGFTWPYQCLGIYTTHLSTQLTTKRLIFILNIYLSPVHSSDLGEWAIAAHGMYESHQFNWFLCKKTQRNYHYHRE